MKRMYCSLGKHWSGGGMRATRVGMEKGGGEQRDRVLSLYLVEEHCLAPWHTQKHTGK